MKILIFTTAFLVAIGILVAVHEFGHYWVAKRLGFKVLRFSIGFGKPLLTRVGRDADRTEYCIAAIPLGGYVKMLDERDGEVAPEELHRSFTRRPVSQRIAVLLAGPAMNLIFASVLYALLAMIGSQVVKPVVGQVRRDSPAAVAGLARGDEIVRVGERSVDDIEELQIALIRRFSGDGVVPLVIRREGRESALTLQGYRRPAATHRTGQTVAGSGFRPGQLGGENRDSGSAERQCGSACGPRGGRPGALGGRAAGGQQMEFQSMVSAAPGREISIEVERDGARLSIVAAVARVMEAGHAIGRLGITLEEGARVLAARPGRHTAGSGPIEALERGRPEDLGYVLAHRTNAVADRHRRGVGEEHQRADQHRGVRGDQRLFGDHRVPRRFSRSSASASAC